MWGNSEFCWVNASVHMDVCAKSEGAPWRRVSDIKFTRIPPAKCSSWFMLKSKNILSKFLLFGCMNKTLCFRKSETDHFNMWLTQQCVNQPLDSYYYVFQHHATGSSAHQDTVGAPAGLSHRVADAVWVKLLQRCHRNWIPDLHTVSGRHQAGHLLHDSAWRHIRVINTV